jgi:hypothetical protein
MYKAACRAQDAAFRVKSHRRRGGHARIVIAAAVAVGLLASASIMIRSSYSAFSATTSNPGSQWSAGSVTLTDNDNSDSIPMFNISGMRPADSRTGCIVVTYGGSVSTSGVKVYIASGDLVDVVGTGPSKLSQHLRLEIYEGDVAGGFNSNVTTNTGSNDAAACTAWAGTNVTEIYNSGTSASYTLNSFATNDTSFGTGAGTWTPTGGSNAKKAYKVVVTLDNSIANVSEAQNGISAAKITFEAQS